MGVDGGLVGRAKARYFINPTLHFVSCGVIEIACLRHAYYLQKKHNNFPKDFVSLQF